MTDLPSGTNAVPNPFAHLLTRILRSVWHAVVLYGALHIPPITPFDPPAKPPDGPPPGHPERLCGDRPPTAEERELWERLRDGRRFRARR
ncbi:DUF6059 family protein [Kitasatospora sp. NPDC058218]|uniref:DUF6059 family protein n=1 Tax=Kitasatospora sp. NPDC058218 TaxID=3346385 RepID=UPI0036D9040B